MQKFTSLPDVPGIYQFYDSRGKLIYVGKSVSIKKRVGAYFTNKNLGPKTSLLVSKIAEVKYIKVFSEFEALLLEAELIRIHQPFFNSIAKDDKSPVYIKITAGRIPLIFLVRKEAPKKDVFLKGPFPSAKIAREILTLARKIFPYCHHRNPKKPCLYVHLGLCPYPYSSQSKQKIYLATTNRIKKLLSGRSKILLRQLTVEMTKAAKAQQFERANITKKQIKQLEYLTTTYHAPQEFLEKPTLVDDLRLAKLKDLTEKLKLEKITGRIECYDISSISGKFATGALAVFINGQADKSQYRRFRIKFTDTPNDYEMIKEVLSRRFKNNWPKPDLIIVDGGRGHLNVACGVLEIYKITAPVVSLAKRFEEIYTSAKILPLALPKESPARQLAQNIRDEAHRFAISYHRLLRSKNLLAKT